MLDSSRSKEPPKNDTKPQSPSLDFGPGGRNPAFNSTPVFLVTLDENNEITDTNSSGSYTVTDTLSEAAVSAAFAVSEDQVKTLLELETYRQRIYDPIRNEAEVNITDEEAQQSSFSYVSISISGDDLTDDDIATRKEQAQEILDKMKEDPTADMGETAKAVDDTYS